MMNPDYRTGNYPVEAFPLQGNRNDGFPGQPDGSRLVQHTTVNINTEPAKDHIIWSLCCFMYGNPCCLGLAALIFSIKARDRKVVGDLEGAQHYGSTARCLNIVATILTSLICLIIIILLIVTAVKVQQVVSYNRNLYRGGYYSW
ncbi:interferon-induced transmembrane protein 1-like [Leuresthes tenuis]|uniref:interferon-induced transmembrane protein 1-like n=1 Tax=Leuresthes tenuis TaxID=355514 RepID=UPI003B50328B